MNVKEEKWGLWLLWVLFQKLLFLQDICRQCSGLNDIITYIWLFWWAGPISSEIRGVTFIYPSKEIASYYNEQVMRGRNTLQTHVMSARWKSEGTVGASLCGAEVVGPMDGEGDGKKWDSLYEISLGNPSDARTHYDCGHGIKARLLLSFLFLLAALKQKIWAVTSLPPPPPTTTPPLCWGSAADTVKQSHSLACISWPETTGRACQVARIRVSVCVVCAYICMCAHTHACPHLSDEAQYSVLGTNCSKNLPFIDSSQTVGAIFELLYLKMETL